MIRRALADVPTRFDQAWVKTTDVTVNALVEVEQARREQAKAEGKLMVTRMLAPLFDIEDPSNRHMQGILRVDGRTYRYEFWTKTGPDAGTVWVQVERDLATGEITGPWDMYDVWLTRPTFVDD